MGYAYFKRSLRHSPRCYSGYQSSTEYAEGWSMAGNIGVRYVRPCLGSALYIKRAWQEIRTQIAVGDYCAYMGMGAISHHHLDKKGNIANGNHIFGTCDRNIRRFYTVDSKRAVCRA